MCTSPRTASYNLDGSINFSKRTYERSMVPFKLPCGKCTECLLERSREWSIRCIHESKMHQNNSFITLTYSDHHLPKDQKLNHTHFQLFMKKLRKEFGQGIGYYMCGEYGDKTLRPHYHACLFGWDPPDKIIWSENHKGDTLWTSKILDSIWGQNDPDTCPNKIGQVTQQSAAYVARYILKKQTINAPLGYQKSSRQNAIGKRWIEKYWKDVFIYAKGSIILSDGTKSKVPRYYEKWLQKFQTDVWIDYVTQTKTENTKRLTKKSELEHNIYIQETNNRGSNKGTYKSPLARKREILKQKQKQLKRSYL